MIDQCTHASCRSPAAIQPSLFVEKFLFAVLQDWKQLTAIFKLTIVAMSNDLAHKPNALNGSLAISGFRAVRRNV